jgi:hypothetical protein
MDPASAAGQAIDDTSCLIGIAWMSDGARREMVAIGVARSDGGLERVAELPPYAAEWRRGFLAMIPLWTGVVPFGVAFGVIARQAGFGVIDAALASLLVFATSSTGSRCAGSCRTARLGHRCRSWRSS